MIPANVKSIMQSLIDNGFEAYIIGGAVRDIVMNETPKDYDIFTNADGKQILKVFPKGVIIGSEERQSKILTVIVDGVEVSQYRKNGERTETGTDLKTHLSTCDFTINAIAMDINGNMIDEHNGISHIDHKILAFVGNPEDRIKEDPLRILRGIRFWTKYGMRFENIKVVLNNIDLLDTLPKERIRDELLKIIQYPTGIENLWCDGIIYKIFPELKDVVDMKGGDHHGEPVDTHMQNCFKTACDITDNVILRLAVLLHDVGKGVTFTEAEGEQTHFYEHENRGEEMMQKRLEYLKFSADDIKYITTLIRRHMYSYKAEPGKKSYIRFFNKLEEAKIPVEDYVMLIYCDHQGNMTKPRIKFGDFIKWNWLYKKYYEIKYSEEPMKVSDLAIGGTELIAMGVKPGPKMGEILNKIFDEVMEGNIKNQKADLMNYAKEMLHGN